MTSKEALKTIFINCKDLLVDENYNVVKSEDLIKIIIQDLKRLEMFEENYDTTVRRNKELIEENEKLKQKLEQIKALPNCDICVENWFSCMCLRKKIKEVLGND